MFPLGDDNSQRRSLPVVTLTLIALNVLVFLVELNAGQAFIQQWAFVPRRFAADPAGQVSTIFTGMFMHGGWLHLFGNMLYLWIFGDNVEDEFGSLKFLVFYLLCGVAATMAQFYISTRSNIPNVGASGAIAGVLGAYLLMFPNARVRVLVYNQIVAMPALIVTHGSTKKKRRPLAKDLIVLGRGPGCDIGLVSPEVANVHCILTRQPTGWTIRDCSGRATRVNGHTITEAPLRDGDSIQIGTFSFEAYLPGMSPRRDCRRWRGGWLPGPYHLSHRSSV